MGFNFFKRLPITKTTGINISKSGLSVSSRHKLGSIGTRGFSIRTGLPGLTFRTSWGGASTKGKGLEMLLFFLLVTSFVYIGWNLIVLIALIAYNLLAFFFFLIRGVLKIVIGVFVKPLPTEEKHFSNVKVDDDRFSLKEVRFSINTMPEGFRDTPVFIKEVITKVGDHVQVGNPVCILSFLNRTLLIYSKYNGTVTWHRNNGDQVFEGDHLVSIIVNEE